MLQHAQPGLHLPSLDLLVNWMLHPEPPPVGCENTELVIKGGMIAWSAMGDPNASIPTPQPVLYRPMFGSYGAALPSTSLIFVSAAALDAGVPTLFSLKKRAVAVKNCRNITKRDMVNNSFLPRVEVDAETYEVRADGELLTCEPATILPMAQRYFLF